MLASYADIIEVAGERQPDFYDSNGVPRYRPFHPDLGPDIYADEVALLKIACQSCRHEVRVQMHSGFHEKMDAAAAKLEYMPLSSRIDAKTVHYGDPPRHSCVGDTMNCIDLNVCEYWRRGKFD